MKIRVKLTLQFFVVVATILILSMYFVYSRFQDITSKEYYNNLKTKAHMTAEMALHKGDLHKLEDISLSKENSEQPISDNVIIFNEKYEKVFTFIENKVFLFHLISFLIPSGNFLITMKISIIMVFLIHPHPVLIIMLWLLLFLVPRSSWIFARL
jgi:hypothetical protein